MPRTLYSGQCLKRGLFGNQDVPCDKLDFRFSPASNFGTGLRQPNLQSCGLKISGASCRFGLIGKLEFQTYNNPKIWSHRLFIRQCMVLFETQNLLPANFRLSPHYYFEQSGASASLRKIAACPKAIPVSPCGQAGRSNETQPSCFLFRIKPFCLP